MFKHHSTNAFGFKWGGHRWGQNFEWGGVRPWPPLEPPLIVTNQLARSVSFKDRLIRRNVRVIDS